MADQFDFAQTARSAELLRVLIDTIDAAQADQKALRYAVCSYITGHNGHDVTLDEITETVRSILANANSGSITPTFGAFERIQTHARELVGWCIAHEQPGLRATS